MNFQIVLSAEEKNEAGKGTRGNEAKGNEVAILKTMVKSLLGDS